MIQACQGKVRGSGLARRLLAAMGNQFAQLVAEGVDQRLDAVGGEHLLAETPAQGQLAAVHLPFHGQPVGQRRLRVLGPAAASASRDEQRLLVELAIELAQVVEGHPWLWQHSQARSQLRRPQVAQQAMTDALAGDAAQLLLDALDGLADLGCRHQ
ncbi:hypothetical protein D3C76_1161660 [compost metagenome]